MKNYEQYMVPLILVVLVAVYTILVFLSEGTIGGADDMTHFRYSRYAFQNPYFFLHHWGKPFFTAVSSPFAQFGYNGIRIFNVLAGTAAVYFSYRMARKLNFSRAIVAIFLVISSPLYTMLMLSGMTEILFSLVLVVSVFLFYEKKFIWSALLLSFLPFVRTEGVVILPLFLVALAWEKQWKAIPFMFFGFVFYSIVGYFHFKDILWVINEMPYKGYARDIYGSGELLHFVKASKSIFGIPLAFLIAFGLLSLLLDLFQKSRKISKEWIMELLVVYMPFLLYFAAHSYVWWKGQGNSVGMIRVIAAVVPLAALLGTRGWSWLMDLIPLKNVWKKGLGVLLCSFLLTVPQSIFQIPVPLGRSEVVVKEASEWMKESDNIQNKIYYYDPFFCHFMNLNPYDEERVRAFVYSRENPELKIKEGEIVIWDAHFSPNEGRLPLEKLMDNPGFRLIHLVRPVEHFQELGGYDYEIYIFQRIMIDDSEDNHDIYDTLVEEILTANC